MMPPTERNTSKNKKNTSKQQQQRLENDIKNNNTFHHRHHKSLTVDKINQSHHLDHLSNKASYARNDHNNAVTTTQSTTTDHDTNSTTGRMIATTSIVSNSLSQDHVAYNLRPRSIINGLPLDDTHEDMNNDQCQHHTATSINSLYHSQLQQHHHRHHPSPQRGGEGIRYHQPLPTSTTIAQHTHNLAINSHNNRPESQHQHSNNNDNCIGGNEENQDTSPSHHHHASGQLHSMTKYRRLKANARERSRMSKMNVAFEELRRLVPYYPKDGKLTKLTTLRLAMRYISALSELLQEDDQRRADLDKGSWPNDKDGPGEKRIRTNFYRQLTEKENYR